jgi:predicted dehydrogenase
MDKLKVGLIGCGHWGKNILKNLLSNDRIELFALCDTNEELLIKSAKQNRISGYVTLHLDSNYSNWPIKELDAVFIATPANTHYDVATNFLNEGVHTFIEKPITLNSLEAAKLIELAKIKNIKLMVGHTFLYNDSVRKLKEIINDKSFGNIVYASSQRLNLGIIREDHNVLWNLAPHCVSIFSYLFDEKPIAVLANGRKYIGKVDDVTFLSLQFKSGIIAQIHSSWIDPVKTRKITIVGEKRMVVYDDVKSEGKIEIYEKGIEFSTMHDMQHGVKLRTGDTIIPLIKEKEPLQNEINHFIDCIQNDKTPLSDGQNGFDVVTVLEAADKSLKDGGWILC